jgi:hypothetical protein
MNNWVTVASFTYSHEAHMAKTVLSFNGLEVKLVDEMTVQINQHIGNAIGGIKLQVADVDVELANRILEESGYSILTPETTNTFFQHFNSVTAQWPLLRLLNVEVRFLTLAFAILLLIIVPVWWYLWPTPEKQLLEKEWCVSFFAYNGVQYQPNTTTFRLIYNQGCGETIRFFPDGKVTLPGFNSPAVHARWLLEESKIKLFNADTLEFVYNGIYTMKINDRSMSLVSTKTIIRAHSIEPLWH